MHAGAGHSTGPYMYILAPIARLTSLPWPQLMKEVCKVSITHQLQHDHRLKNGMQHYYMWAEHAYHMIAKIPEALPGLWYITTAKMLVTP